MSEQFVYGVHAVAALLNSKHRTTRKLFLSQERMDSKIKTILEKANQLAVVVEHLSVQNMNKRFADYVHQGVVAQASALPDYSERDLESLLTAAKKPALILILDSVTDPHNLGACLRSADAVGVDFVIIPKDKSASITPVVSKVACGAAESVPVVRVTNLARTMELLKEQGVWIYGAAGEATCSLYQIPVKDNMAVVLGAEGEGLRRLTRERCDELFSLPMMGSVESLNVSVATGVVLYEILRSRSQ
jgi:23S rRNA (guanosine2251-2'-O)-methyltransferase